MALGDILATADATYRSAAPYLNAVVIALAILFVGFVIARIAGSILARLFTVTRFDDHVTKAIGRRRHYARATRTTIVRVLYVVAVYYALQSLRVAGVAISVIVGVIVAIILVSLTLSAVELIPNLLARSRLRSRRVFVGDEIEIDHPSGKISGKIVEMNLLEVQVRRPGGDLVFFPNASLLGVRITKHRAKR